MAENLVVTTEWLHQRLADSDLRIIDIRGHVIPASEPPPHYFNHYGDYLKSHIPGAAFVDWVYEITDPDDPRHAQIAKPDRYAAVMSRLGVSPQTFVVAYDDYDSMFAARLWWSLNYYGHERAAVLDGGWKKWIAEGRPVTAQIPQFPPARFEARPNAALRRTGEQVLSALHSAVRLLDMRSAAEFAGEASRARRAGRIPGAVNQPRQLLLNADGTILPPDQLRERFAAIGVDDSVPEIVTYCNAGVSASFGMLALRLAGLHNVSMYDGSWKDWGNDDSKPIETTWPR